MARPFTRTTVRIHPDLLRAAQKLAAKRSETFSAMLRRYMLEGMERDGVTIELTVAIEEEEVREPTEAPWLPKDVGGLDV